MMIRRQQLVAEYEKHCGDKPKEPKKKLPPKKGGSSKDCKEMLDELQKLHTLINTDAVLHDVIIGLGDGVTAANVGDIASAVRSWLDGQYKELLSKYEEDCLGKKGIQEPIKQDLMFATPIQVASVDKDVEGFSLLSLLDMKARPKTQENFIEEL